jgi:hypothetical protein
VVRRRPAPGSLAARALDPHPPALERWPRGHPESPDAAAHQSPLCPATIGRWPESALLAALGGVVVLAMTVPAFGAYFFAENFLYIGKYRAFGDDFLRAVLSPTDDVFFRPLFTATGLLWELWTPLDPWLYHARNLALTVVNLLLLARILAYLVSSRAARVAALALFAVSKVHFTAIGYVTVFESIQSLTLLLAALLCFLRYRAWGRRRDYALGLLFGSLAVFTKDYGLVIVVVLAALVVSAFAPGAAWRTWLRPWAIRLAPLLVVVVAYLGLRASVVGLVPPADPSGASEHAAYAPELSPDVAGAKLLVFASTLANLSYERDDVTGAGGIGAGLRRLSAGFASPTPWIDHALFVGFLALLLLTLWRGRRAGWALLFPLVWVAAYFGPTLLTRNIQMYYLYEALAGVAVLLALCLDRAERCLRAVWGVALGVIALNGLVSNYTSLYTWQFVANAAQQAHQPLVVAHRGEPLASVTFVTRSRPFWEWTLTKEGKGPMLPELLSRPGLAVRFLDYDDLPAHAAEANATNLFFDIDNGFVAYHPGQPRPPLVLQAIAPTEITAGVGFNVQPGGQSALAVEATHATPGTSVMLGEMRLPTTYASATYLTALVPAEAITRPGRYPVYLNNGIDESNRVDLVVLPARPPGDQ